MTSAPGGSPDERELLAYELLTQRQLEHQSLTWQTPGLSLTAQAFLLTIALGSDSTNVSRVIAGLIGICVGLLAMQLMDKHRVLGSFELLRLDAMEDQMQLPLVTHVDTSPLALPGGIRPYRTLPRWRWWHRLRSQVIWQVGLAAFVAANLAVILIVLTDHGSLLST